MDKNAEGSKYCGITLDWDYEKRKVRLSMPDTVQTRYNVSDTTAYDTQISRMDTCVPMYR